MKNKYQHSLSADQKSFLISQNIPISQVFDAKDLTRSEYHSIMRDLDKLIAYNTTPCKNHGHTLRTLYGHCAQCNTHALAFIKRYSQAAIIYVLYSDILKSSKLGVCLDIEERLRTLRSQKYGGANDWNLVKSYKTNSAGRVEYQVSEKLTAWRVDVEYIRTGHTIKCKEIYSCMPNVITQIIENL